MRSDTLEQRIEQLMSQRDGNAAAALLAEHLADPGFVELLSRGDWGDDQAALARLMRFAAMAEVVLAHPDEVLRSQAANWLSCIQDENARLGLIARAALDEADLVRACAAEAIADQAPHPTLSSTVLRLLADDDVLVRSIAVHGAMQQGLERELREVLLSEGHDRVLVSFHCALAAKGYEASIEELYAMLTNGDYMVRHNAMNGLDRVPAARGSARFQRAILELATHDGARAVSVRAQEICGELGLTPQGASPVDE